MKYILLILANKMTYNIYVSIWHLMFIYTYIFICYKVTNNINYISHISYKNFFYLFLGKRSTDFPFENFFLKKKKFNFRYFMVIQENHQPLHNKYLIYLFIFIRKIYLKKKY